MHLTNYSINKISPNYIRSDELFEPTPANKQTITSAKNTLLAQGQDWDSAWEEIKDLIAKSLISLQPYLVFSRNEVIGKSGKKTLKGFHIIGFDVLLDTNLKPWLLEINNHPSLNIEFESAHFAGPDQIDRSIIDEHIKSIVVIGAIELALNPVETQVELDGYHNYTRVLPMDSRYDTEIGFLSRLWRLFDHLTGIRGCKTISAGRFRL
jgi:hypothetical protein